MGTEWGLHGYSMGSTWVQYRGLHRYSIEVYMGTV